MKLFKKFTSNSFRKTCLIATAILQVILFSTSVQAQATNTLKSSNHIKTNNIIAAKAEDISPLLIGEAIPTVQLLTAEGKTFDLNKAVSEKPTMLVFYRGGWCPYCSLQLAGLMKIEPELIKLGYQVLAISTDSPENLKKTLSKEALNYTLLSDADLSVARQFGIAYNGSGKYNNVLLEGSGGKNQQFTLPVPSIFFINKKGNIRFEYINPNFRERVSSELLKAVAQALITEM